MYKVTFTNLKLEVKTYAHIFQAPPTISELLKAIERIEDSVPVSRLPEHKEDWQIVSISTIGE